ncbi:MAG: hypothetical protein A3J82_04330 [Elusimicrobia bacterium RIFOXYA2_FULL_69_6]|nr:MAG: hypothetical protein A3J82_04330 [Elusimicrobia bacterium RIFOXYA2_FULL_69_6]
MRPIPAASSPPAAEPVLSAQAAGLLLLCALFCGFFAGGLRDAALAAPVLFCAALTALLGPRPSGDLLRPWLYFLGWAALSLVASAQPLMGLSTVSRWAVLALFFCSACASWGEKERRAWFWGLGACAAVLAAAAALVDRPGYPFTGILPPYYNYTCFVEAAFFSAALAAVLRPDGPRGAWRALAAVLGALALAEVFWANSRGALAAAAVGAGVFAWRNLPRARSWSAAAAAALLLAAFAALATLDKLDVAPAFKRPQIWRSALAVAAEDPVLGAGPGEFANAFLRHNFPAGYGLGMYRARAEHAHSEVMEALAQFGFPGLLLLLAALWAGLRAGPPASSSWTREAALAAAAAMTAQCLIDNMLHLPALGLLYFSALAAARAPDGRAAGRGAPAWRPLAWAALLLAGLSWLPGALVERWSAAGGIGSLLRAARLAPADPYLREALAWAWLAESPPQVDEALRQLARAEALSPCNAVYPAERARLLKGRGDWPGTLERAGRAVSLEPDYLGARLLRAEALLSLGRRDESREELDEVGRRAKALAGQLNAGSGYESFLLRFDAGLYRRLRSG